MCYVLGVIGFIGDVHGDLKALEWALETLRDVDRVICLGDIVDGEQDQECVALLQARGVEVLQGNHDYWAAIGLTNLTSCPKPTLDWLHQLPREVSGENWRAYHSFYRNSRNEFHWYYLHHADEARKAVDDCSEQVIFCGHTHVPLIHGFEGTGHQSEPVGDHCHVAVRAGVRYLVNVGRPTQCVVRWNGETIHLRFHPRPRFERRFAFPPPPPPPPAPFQVYIPPGTAAPPAPEAGPSPPALRWWRRQV